MVGRGRQGCGRGVGGACGTPGRASALTAPRNPFLPHAPTRKPPPHSTTPPHRPAAHLLGPDPRPLQRALDAHDDAAPLGLGLGHVVRVAGISAAHKLGQDGRAPGLGVLQLLQDQHAWGRGRVRQGECVGARAARAAAALEKLHSCAERPRQRRAAPRKHAPAPSPITKPSRPWSQGRLAAAGSSFRLDSACGEQAGMGRGMRGAQGGGGPRGAWRGQRRAAWRGAASKP